MSTDKPIKVKYVIIEGLMKSDLADVVSLVDGMQAIGEDPEVTEVGEKPVERAEVTMSRPAPSSVQEVVAPHERPPEADSKKGKGRNGASKNEEPAWSAETATPLGTLCSVCHAPQVNSPGGPTCKNGHGGAAPLDEETAGVPPDDSTEAEEVVAPKVEAKPETNVVKLEKRLPAELIGTSKVKDVVVYVVGQGAKTKEEVVAACSALRSKIPCLAKVTNLDERVGRILETLND
jgi:hypothetical protein